MEKSVTKYRKKKLVEAVKTFADVDGIAFWKENPPWLLKAVANGIIFERSGTKKILLREGVVDLIPGSWIVKNDDSDDIWPVAAEVFFESYEKVE